MERVVNCTRTLEDVVEAAANNKAYHCGRCGKSYHYYSGLYRHTKYECGIEPQFESLFSRILETKQENSDHHQTARSFCIDCGKNYKNRRHLLRHQKWECGGERTFRCNICDYDKTSTTCSNCGKTYKNRTSMLRHRRLECGVEPRFHCELCGKSFKRKEHLQTHVVLVHASKIHRYYIDQRI
uniref:C2H2-type domain-containing protein n=1 Tax=Rhodnius prolixus TaxID=13249 RepID=T1HBV5_RHOPR